jgi:pimeloyl-ACP methyl ester carboxylesterase
MRKKRNSLGLLSVVTAVFALSLCCAKAAYAQQFSISEMVSEGDSTPVGGTFSDLQNAFVTSSGDVTFENEISGGSSSSGIFSSSGSSITKLVAVGDVTPIGGTFSDVGSISLGAFHYTDVSGAVVFGSNVSGGTASYGIFRILGGSISRVVAIDDPSPVGGTFSTLQSNSFTINAAGDVAFGANVLNSGTSSSGIFKASQGSITKIVLKGETAPTGGTFDFIPYRAFITSSGAVIFRADLSGGSAATAVFSASGGAITTLVSAGDPTPIGGTFSGVSLRDVNASGAVLFEGPVSGGTASRGLFIVSGGSVSTVAYLGQSTPLGGTFSNLVDGSINEGEDVVFTGKLSGGSASEGIFVFSSGTLSKIVAPNDPVPTGGLFTGVDGPRVNLADQVSFRAVVGTTEGIFLTTSTGGGTILHSISGHVTSGGIGLSGVAMSLSGAASQTTTTDSNGNYTFTGLSGGSYTIAPSKTGCTFSPSSLPVTVSGQSVTGQNFTATCGGAPTVTTGSATSVAQTSATLNGTIIPNGLSTSGWFEWGKTTSYENTTSSDSLGSGSNSTPISKSISGLSSNTTYHFRAVGQNSLGPAYGADVTFTTTSTPGQPDIDVQPPSWNYGDTQVFTARSQVFAVQNTGAATLSVTGTSFIGPDFSQFAVIIGGAPFSVPPGGVQNVTVQFVPTSTGSKSATLRITSNDPDENPKDILLSGTGTQTPGLSVSWVTPPPTSVTSGQSFFVSWSVSGASSFDANVHWDPTNPGGPGNPGGNILTSCDDRSTSCSTSHQSGKTSETLTAPTISPTGFPVVVKYLVHVRVPVGGNAHLFTDIHSITINPTGGPGSFTLNQPTTSCSGSNPQIHLSWTSFSGAVNYYKVFRNNSFYADVGSNLSYTNTAVTAGTSYSYYVQASNSAGQTRNSNTAIVSAPSDCGGPTGSVPVVLVHGWGGDGDCTTNPDGCTFGQTESLLENEGFTVYSYNYRDLTSCSSPETMIQQIAGKFWEWLGDQGPGHGSKIDVVAHSMGGLVVRAYMAGMGIEEGGTPVIYGGEIRRLVMIGTPNYGVRVGIFASLASVYRCLLSGGLSGLSTQAAQQQVGSRFLWDLNSQWQSINFDSSNILIIAGIKGNLLPSPSIVGIPACFDFDTPEGDDDGVVNVRMARLRNEPNEPEALYREVPYKHSPIILCPINGKSEAFIESSDHLSFATLVPFLQNGIAPELYTRRRPGGIWQSIVSLLPFQGLESSRGTQSVTASLAWTELPDGGLTPLSPAVATARNGDVYVVVQGTDDRIYLNIQRNGIWLGWGAHSSGLTGSSPAAVVDTTGNLRVFLHGVDDYIYQSTYTGGGWSEWVQVPGGGITFSAPEATVNPVTGELSLVIRGIDSKIYLNTQLGATWSGWSALPVGGLTLSELGATYDSSGTLWLFVRGIDARIWVTSNSGGSWNNWALLGGTTYSGLAAAASGNIVAVFARGVDDHIYINTYRSGEWSGWGEVPGDGITLDAPAAAVDNQGNVLLFVRGL